MSLVHGQTLGKKNTAPIIQRAQPLAAMRGEAALCREQCESIQTNLNPTGEDCFLLKDSGAGIRLITFSRSPPPSQPLRIRAAFGLGSSYVVGFFSDKTRQNHCSAGLLVSFQSGALGGKVACFKAAPVALSGDLVSVRSFRS